MPSIKRSEREAELRNDGYTDTAENRGILDTVVLTKGDKVVRLGTDPAINIFVDFIESMSNISLHLPVVHNHQFHDPPTPFPVSNEQYWETEMELLEEISEPEIQAYREWISEYDCALRKGDKVRDFHGLLSVVDDLYAHATKMNVTPDFKQAKNLMKRKKDGHYVIIDAFA